MFILFVEFVLPQTANRPNNEIDDDNDNDSDSSTTTKKLHNEAEVLNGVAFKFERKIAYHRMIFG